MRWAYDFELTSPVISFQVKLYETTNIIEYIYRQEAAPYNPGYNGASIGLMGTTSTNFISLSDSSASPTVSTTTSTNNIEVKPATGQIYRFTPSGADSYSWTSSPAGFTSTVASPVVSPTVSTTYNLTVTSSQGCSATAAPLAVNVQTESPVISAQPESLVRCAGQGATFTVASSTTSALTYQWRRNGENLVNGTGIAGATSATLTLSGITALSAGTYDVVITTCTSLSTTSDQVTLTVNDLPTIVVTPSNSTYCSPGGTAVALTASGASTYAWSPSTGLSATTGNTVNASPSSTTTYVVTGTDANGCVNSSTASVNVTVKPQNVVASATPANICVGASTNLTATANPIVGVANYAFNSSNGTYTPITGGTVIRTGTSTLDSYVSGALTIPSFTLNGVSYTTAYMTSNGFVTLGTSAASAFTTTAISTTTGSGIALCPFSADLDRVNSTVATDMRWQTVGDEIIFQWTQFKRYLQTENFDFQVRLNRVTGVVSFVYRLNSGPGSGTSYQPQVGIRTSATDFKNISVGTGSESWSSPLASTSNSSLVRFTSASPAQAFVSGLTYTFTPPAPITYTWSSSNVVNANSATTATTALTSTETFSVIATNGTCTTTAQTTVNVIPNQTWYQDTDGDGYGKTDVTLVNCTQPVGYVLLSGDCNDNNPAVNPGATEVCWNGIDDDCDGLQSEGCSPVVVNMATANNTTLPSFAMAVAAQPYSYAGSTTRTYRFTITNNQTGVSQEVASPTRFVTIPQNMRNYNVSYTVTAAAVIDGENVPYAGNTITVFSPVISLVKLAPTSCGVTLASLTSNIASTVGLNAISYTFRARLTSDNGPTPQYYYVQSPSRFVSMNSFIGLTPQYSTSYTVDVQFEFIDVISNTAVQSGYGETCTVVTPSIPLIGLSSPTCGTTVSSLGATISASPALFAQQYEFRIRLTSDNGTEPTYYYTVPSASRFSSLSAFQGVTLQYSTSYTVSVRYMIMNGTTPVWSNFGPACAVTTPSFPVTEITPSLCGLSTTGLDQTLTIVPYPGFPTYRVTLFEQVGEDLIPVGSINRTVANFKLNMFTAATVNKNYSVSVAIQLGGVFGPDGKACDLSTMVARLAKVPFAVVAYPNPYSSAFQLDVNTSETAGIDITVYDMVGRLVEQRSVTVNEIETVAIGERYPSGVYNVVVTQGEQTKTLRVVKR